jgi:hypothetical protein
VGATESAGPTDAGTPCPLNDPASVAIKPYEMTPLALSAGQSIRMYSLTKPSDVFVFLITPNQEEFALVETPAEDLLNTLHFP